MTGKLIEKSLVSNNFLVKDIRKQKTVTEQQNHVILYNKGLFNKTNNIKNKQEDE